MVFIKKNPFVILLLVGVILWIVSIPLVILYYGEPGSSSEFGDMFGAVNALFSGLALAGIIYAIIIQRQELILTRQELARTAGAQIESAKSLEKQLGLQVDSSRLAALASLVDSYNEQINQNDRWNERLEKRKYDNTKVISKRKSCEDEIRDLLGKLDEIE